MYILKLSADSNDLCYLEITVEQGFNLQYNKIVIPSLEQMKTIFSAL